METRIEFAEFVNLTPAKTFFAQKSDDFWVPPRFELVITTSQRNALPRRPIDLLDMKWHYIFVLRLHISILSFTKVLCPNIY